MHVEEGKAHLALRTETGGRTSLGLDQSRRRGVDAFGTLRLADWVQLELTPAPRCADRGRRRL